ncbi:phenylacetate--CoA ligase family protein [Pelagibius litoralis]|uniref:Phenylacetate--CoA ligase family protein n=1 Tax=Pelagibius litoralis TaxID=374515 RepID=A0A967C5X1_9PROT|nr:phenylacetate--CoA ligase family protein [Pelagibius litoralis]NIA68036.1 phenylacetate--CoA ligase family protein [Pelagibius litoralis]
MTGLLLSGGMTVSSPTAPPVYRPLPSAHSTVAWPALPAPEVALMGALLQQLDESQWWAPEDMRAQQLRQANALLVHAYRTVPFYRDRLAQAGFVPGQTLTEDVWSAIPILTRADLQEAGDRLLSTQIPERHGKTYDISSSGSTGRPVKAKGTRLVQFFWDAMTLREHIWHRRDFQGKLAAVRSFPSGVADYPAGALSRHWGRSTKDIFATGPSAMLTVSTRTNDQVEWLLRQQPAYLLTYPSALQELLIHCKRERIRIPGLLQVRTLSEALNPEIRGLCRDVLDLEIADLYSTQENGYLAFQCPEQGAYHVQAESALLEVLDEQGRACVPGEVGHVVVTSLHNFAMPMLRYAVGDLAEAGALCPCGRGLPVLNRILGRVRNVLVYPDGRRSRPRTIEIWEDGVLDIRQMQIIQHALDDIEIRLVTGHPFAEAEEKLVQARFHQCTGHNFSTRITYHQEIPRGPSGKFEDFRSEVAD